MAEAVAQRQAESDDRWLPKGFLIGAGITILVGLIPVIGFIGAALGVLIAGYIDEYGVIEGIGAGLILGCLSAVPVIIWGVIGVFVTGAGAVFKMDFLVSLGVLGGFGGVFYGQRLIA